MSAGACRLCVRTARKDDAADRKFAFNFLHTACTFNTNVTRALRRWSTREVDPPLSNTTTDLDHITHQFAPALCCAPSSAQVGGLPMGNAPPCSVVNLAALSA